MPRSTTVRPERFTLHGCAPRRSFSEVTTHVPLLVLLVVLLVGCGGAAATRARVVVAANASETVAVSVFEDKGKACVTGSATLAQASACWSKVQTDWSPVWAAFDALASADDVVTEWCAFASVVSPLLTNAAGEPLGLPAVDGVFCPASPTDAGAP